MTVSTAVLGGSGFLGGELIRLLGLHPEFELAAVGARRAAGEAVVSVQPVFSALATPAGSAGILDLFGAERSLQPVTLLRLARAPAAPPPSPRLPLDRICVVDRAAWRAGA